MKDIYVNKELIVCDGETKATFEDQKAIRDIVWEQSFPPFKELELKPDTFYQIEADWEIVEGCAHDSCPADAGCKHCMEPKKIARLKVPAPTVATDNSGEKSYADVFKKLGAYIVSEVAITKNQLEIFKESKNRDMVSRCDSAIRIYEKLSDFLAKELPRKS